MTTSERIARLREDIKGAQAEVARLQQERRDAENDLFRERHGYGVGDWVLHDGEPAFVVRVSTATLSPENDNLALRPLTKRGKVSLRELPFEWNRMKHTSPWPAGRPFPEVKP